jgi:hypothetical protein
MAIEGVPVRLGAYESLVVFDLSYSPFRSTEYRFALTSFWLIRAW